MVMMMNKHEFKAGDKVYCPMLGTGVYTLFDTKRTTYPIGIRGERFTSSGRFYNMHPESVSALYPVTKENHRLLSKLHGVEFELPELTGSDRVRQLLKENPNRAVLCGVSNDSEEKARRRPLRVVVGTRFDGYFLTEGSVNIGWAYAVPVDESELKPQELYTGK